MRIDIVENSPGRLHLALRVRLPAYLFPALLFIGLGLWCVKLLVVDPPDTVEGPALGPALGLVLGLICMAGGLVILAAVQWVSLEADRDRGTLQITRRLLVWPFEWRHVLRLDELQAIHVLAHTLRTSKHVTTSYAMRLQKHQQDADDAVSLTFLPMFGAGSVTTLARMIRAWMQPRRIGLLQHARGWPLR